MDRLKALRSFALVTVAVFLSLRAVHVAVPLVFPETRLGPVIVARLEDVRRQVGFAPYLPAYRPAALGDQPSSMTVWLSPAPAFEIVWRGVEHDLALRQRKGGPEPSHPALGTPMTDVADSMWWMAGGRSHLILFRDGFWIELETSLPERELTRFADTLTPYRR
jgi:hypothetical protein